MPEAPSANMALVLPTEGGDDGLWDQYLNDALGLVDSHDHSTGKGVKVKTAGLDINADLTLASGGVYSGITNAKCVDFQPHAASAMTAYAGALFTNSTDSNNLYFRTQAGANVRITNGATLDTTTSGGIGGDYAAIPAEVAYIDASDTYTFRQTAAGNWARLQSGSLRIAETGTTESTYVEIAAPTVLGSSYTLTMPGAVPGANGTLMQVTTAGVATFSNTGLAATTFASTVTVGSTLGVTGLITATAGATADAGADFTVSTTGRFRHGTRYLSIPSAAGSAASTWPVGAEFSTSGASGRFFHWPVMLESGKTMTDATIYYQRGGGTLTFTFSRAPLPSGAAVVIATTTVASGTSATSVSLGAFSQLVSTTGTQQYWVTVESGSATDVLRAVVITYND